MKIRNPSSDNSEYFPEIDVLRAVAVISVIFFHADFAAFRGGFIGVDIFFVLSGYLITKIVYTQISYNQYSMKSFLLRRFRRILPALVFVCLVCVYPSAYFLMPDEIADFGQSLIATMIFQSNMLFWFEKGNYFLDAQSVKPLLHTWSLSVEMTFYILFSAAVYIAIFIFNKNSVFIILLSIFMFGFPISNNAAIEDSNSAFFWSIYRFWEFGIGGLAYFVQKALNFSGIKNKSFLVWLSFLIILISILSFDSMVYHPSTWTLIPNACVFLILVFGKNSINLSKNSIGQILCFIGLISYSLYLWHQPLFAFYKLSSESNVSTLGYFVIILISILLSVFTWRYIEIPFRYARTINDRKFLSLSIISLIVLVSVGAYYHFSSGLSFRIGESTKAHLQHASDYSPHRRQCHSNPAYTLSPTDACIFGDKNAETVNVWSDSTGVELAWALSTQVSQDNLSVKQLSFTGCAPVLSVAVEADNFDEEPCAKYNQEVMSYILRDERSSITIMMGVWGLDFYRATHPRHPLIFPHSIEQGKEYASYFRDTIEELTDMGKVVVIVHSSPRMPWSVPKQMARRDFYAGSGANDVSIARDFYALETDFARVILDEALNLPGVIGVDVEDVLCSENLSSDCLLVKNDSPLFFDSIHLSGHGAKILSSHILSVLADSGAI